ncbi:MAG TPA: ABC transporter ATP-binding protein, partial [Candidatus Acidoferrales bacterium]|nr:ABC transporter ATP-binding protein [Candidatus Acidoferrales bacterium]
MSEIAICGVGLGKRYRIGALSHQTSLRERITHTMKAPLRWLHSNGRGNSNAPRDYWALRDVTFDIAKGEVVGLIGRNGAGKSTLLKILSRVTQPTMGRAEIHGRVGSLLEVGTGFHPELTGRENTYLNGAILGMAKKEIERKFDEIVAFAEVANFIDTPIKHYSSGMQMRLAFAVAAHLDPEVLFVDEVLAVGDAQFQKKCLGKMEEVSRQGRTIVLVSHNMGAIGQLCKRCLVLDKGKLILDSTPEEAIAVYVRANVSSTTEGPNHTWERSGSQLARITSIELIDNRELPCNSISMGCDLLVKISGSAQKCGMTFTLAIQFISQNGIPVLYLYDQFSMFRTGEDGTFLIQVRVPKVLLMPGSYSLHVWIGRAGQETFDYVKHA